MESVMSDQAEKRYYRKKLTSNGMVYLADKELAFRLKNISITGLFIIIENKDSLHDIDQLFALIKKSPTVDFYLPDLRMAGEAAIVRAEMDEQDIMLGLEFIDISHNVDNFYR